MRRGGWKVVDEFVELSLGCRERFWHIEGALGVVHSAGDPRNADCCANGWKREKSRANLGEVCKGTSDGLIQPRTDVGKLKLSTRVWLRVLATAKVD